MIFIRGKHHHSGTERWFHVINGCELETSNGMSFWTIDEIKIIEIQEYDSWFELYLRTNFCDLEVQPETHMDLWISPKGLACYGDPFYEYAPDILNFFYKSIDRNYQETATNVLKRIGWVNTALDIYNTTATELEVRVTKQQMVTIKKWAEANKVDIENVKFIEVETLSYKGVLV